MVNRGPKYLLWRFNEAGVDVRWSMMDYGLMPTALLWADVTPAQQIQAEGLPDVITIPENIDQAIGTANALSQVQAALESLHIPSGWITVGHTYREVMRKVAGLFLFAQRYHGRHAAKLIEAGYGLNSLISDLPANVRASLNDTAQSLGYDTDPIAGSWTVRQALKYLADQWGDAPLLIGGIEL
jgi:hypothetical protein